MSTLKVTLRPYCLPLRVPVRTAHGWWRERTGVWLRVEDETGRVGWGEAAPVPGFDGPDLAVVTARLQRLEGWISHPDLDEAAREPGPAGFAVASARADLAGNAEADEATRALVLSVAALLPAGREALTRVDALLEAGFRTFKWKVGVGPGAEERPLLDDLLARLPDTARVRLDANGAWDRREAERWLGLAAERPIEFVEQPIAPTARGADDVLRGLAEDFPTPIALDESLSGPDDLAKWSEVRWPGVWVVKPALLGDPAAVRATLLAAGADVVFSTALETAVGLKAALRAAWSWPGPRRALGFGVGRLFEAAACNGPVTLPWWRWSEVEALNPEAAWNALS